MPPLRIGMVGDDVVSLQLALVAVGLLSGEPSGAFDVVTQKAVIEMQRRAGLAQTGVMDDASWNALYAMQASVAPAAGVSIAAPKPGTTYMDPVNVTGVPSRGTLLFWGLLAGGAYWFTHKDQVSATNEYDDDDEDGDEEDDDEDEYEDDLDDDFEPPGAHMRDLDDAVTDSLIDEPAVISASGRAGDCKKAAMRLMRVQALVQRPSERNLYENVVKKVARNCQGEADAIKTVIEEESERQEEMTDELFDVIGQTAERNRTDDRDRESNIKERLKAQTKWKKGSSSSDGPSIRTHGEKQSRSKLYESGFRKVKAKLTKKTTTEGRQEGVRGRGRRGASAVAVRRGGKHSHSLRKEKAKTKRGYTWRRED